MRPLHSLPLILSITAFAACSSSTSPGSDAATDTPAVDAVTTDSVTPDADAMTNDASALDSSVPEDASADSGTPSGWVSRTDTYIDAQIQVQRVVYLSGGLQIQGQVCRPIANGRHPIMVFNHGGFSGLGAEWTDTNGTCGGGARAGYVVVESSYRGEDGSQGNVEVCLGEADDARALLELVRLEPFADPARVGIAGASHGGCITLRMVQRGAPAQVAVDFFGPTDLTAEYRFWEQQLPLSSPGVAAVYQSLIDTVHTATGGTPDMVPAEYARRSPLGFSADLASSPTAVIILHGTADPLVPLAQSCSLVAAAGGFENYHLDAMQMETAMVPTGCESAGLTFLPTARPRMHWPGQRYFVAYEGQGHDFNGAAGMASIADYIDYLLARFPPG